MKTITSLQNPEIKIITGLHFTRERHQTKQFIAEGIRSITTLLENKVPLIQIYVIPNLLEDAFRIADQKNVTEVSEQILKKMSATTSPSGMLAVFQMPETPAAHLLTPGLVLANISDPGNMGTLIRTCSALNIKSIVVVEGVDPYNPKVVQASAGTLGSVQIFSWDWNELLENKGKLKLNALVVADGEKTETIDPKYALLVVGSEAHGIPDEWLADCDQKVTIPMPGNVESLNAAVAGSIAAYQVFNK
jgi:TrmH family RNA methyltransferase